MQKTRHGVIIIFMSKHAHKNDKYLTTSSPIRASVTRTHITRNIRRMNVYLMRDLFERPPHDHHDLKHLSHEAKSISTNASIRHANVWHSEHLPHEHIFSERTFPSACRTNANHTKRLPHEQFVISIFTTRSPIRAPVTRTHTTQSNYRANVYLVRDLFQTPATWSANHTGHRPHERKKLIKRTVNQKI